MVINLETATGHPRHVFELAARQFAETRNPRERKDYAESIVKYSTESNFDCLSVLRALDLAYKEMMPGGKNKEGGMIILEGIEEYFDKVGNSSKLLIPFRIRRKESFEEEISETRQVIDSIQSHSSVVKRLPWFTKLKGPELHLTSDSLVNHSKNALNDLKVSTFVLDGQEILGTVFEVIMTIPHRITVLESLNIEEMEKKGVDESGIRVARAAGVREKKIDQSPYDVATKTYESVFSLTKKLVIESANTREHNEEKSRIRYEILKLAKTAAENKFEGIPDILTHKWDGISLQDIIDFKATVAKSEGKVNREYKRVDRLGKMILRYISAVPGGDFLWQRIVEGLFLIQSDANEITDGMHPDEIHFAKKVFKFQKWMTEKLLLPSFADIYSGGNFKNKFAPYMSDDPQFRELFGKALNHLDRFSAQQLGLLLYQTSSSAAGSISRFHPSISIDQAAKSCPIIMIAKEMVLQREQANTYIHVNREINKLFNSRWIQLRDSIIQSLVGKVDFRKLNFLYAGLISRAGVDYDLITASRLIDSFEEKLGGNFMEQLGQKKSDIEQINRIIIEEMKNIDYWPHSHLSHAVEFSEESLPEIMGLKSIQYIVGDNMQDKVSFQLRIADGSWGIAGNIGQDGSITWNLDKSQLPEGLNTILNYIVLAYFRDLLVVGKIETRERKPRNEIQPSDKGNKLKKKKNRTELLPHPLQRTRIIYTPSPSVIASENVIHTIESRAENSGFTPRRVGTHRRTLRGTDNYLKAVQEYEQAQEGTDREQKYQVLIEARKKLAQPSAEKIRHLSTTRFQLDDMLHPLTNLPLPDITRDEKVILKLKTWVKQFESPALSPDEVASLPIRYTKRYKAGSATAFGDRELVLWIKGLDAGNPEEEES